MSSRAARALGVQRQVAAPVKTDEGLIVDTGSGKQASVTAVDTLVAIIPSETIAFYTPIMTVVVSQVLKDTPEPDRYMGLRWSLWVAGIVITVLLIARDKLSNKSNLKWATAEMVSAGLAFGVWALTTPESPLLAEVEDKFDTLTTIILTLTTLFVLAFISSVFLTKKKK
jgi:hypothetical protein